MVRARAPICVALLVPLLLARPRLRRESRPLPPRGASIQPIEESTAVTVTFADFTALAVLVVVTLWLLRSEAPRALLRALRRPRDDDSMNMEDIR